MTHQRGVQWKQGVVICMLLYTCLLHNTTPIHCTPLRLHPPLMNTQECLVSLLVLLLSLLLLLVVVVVVLWCVIIIIIIMFIVIISTTITMISSCLYVAIMSSISIKDLPACAPCFGQAPQTTKGSRAGIKGSSRRHVISDYHMYVYVYIYIYTYIYIYIYMYTHIHMYVCMCVCI